MGWEKIVDIFSWLKDKLPIPNRLEGIKDEISNLEKERMDILGQKATVKNSKRISWINDRLSKLRGMLANATGSS